MKQAKYFQEMGWDAYFPMSTGTCEGVKESISCWQCVPCCAKLFWLLWKQAFLDVPWTIIKSSITTSKVLLSLVACPSPY